MNYYMRYMGDYHGKTAHLSLAEHGAYTMLLDAYYAAEKPLPQDYKALYRLCRAMTKAEQDAVRSVADQFFPVGEDGMRYNARADDEIERARPRMEAARINGRKGGRPRKATEPDAITETQEKPTGFSPGSETKTQTEPRQNPERTQTKPRPKAPHTPYPIIEKPPTESFLDIGRKPEYRAQALASRFEDFWAAYPKKVGKAAVLAKWKAKRLDARADELIADVQLRAGTDRKWLDGFVPNPLTYLTQERWQDEIERVPNARTSAGGKPTPADITKTNLENFGRRLAASGGS